MSETHEHALVERTFAALLALESEWSTRVLALALDCLAADDGYRARLATARPELAARAANLAQILAAPEPNIGHRQGHGMGHQNSRRWDGQRETARDTKFFDLRDSGYTGPIDEHGNAVTTGPDAETLRRMAEQRGEDVRW